MVVVYVYVTQTLDNEVGGSEAEGGSKDNGGRVKRYYKIDVMIIIVKEALMQSKKPSRIVG